MFRCRFSYRLLCGGRYFIGLNVVRNAGSYFTALQPFSTARLPYQKQAFTYGSAQASNRLQEEEEMTAKQQQKVEDFDWGYTEANGPNVWAKYFQHGAGQNQSPVDIQQDKTTFATELTSPTPLTISWPQCYATLCNTGASWRLSPHAGTEMTLTGGPVGAQTYQLLQAHAHWPSEHLIDSEQYELEVHFVHKNTKYATMEEALRHRNGLAVVGILYSSRAKSRRQEDMRDLLAVLCEMCGEIRFRDDVKDLSDEPIDWQAFLPDDLVSYYTYSGSLTTPPLNECVTWILMREICRVDAAQLKTLRSMCALSRAVACDMGCIPSTEEKGLINGHAAAAKEEEQNDNENGRRVHNGIGEDGDALLEPHLLKATCRPAQPLNNRKVYRSWQ